MGNFEKPFANSIYIHIPFCRRKCNYCAFISVTNIKELENLYINSLCNEISSFSSENEINTIYLGGGTPNILSLKSIEKIFNQLNQNFKISKQAEITMEFNPKISDLSYIKEVKNFGINRISLGVQSFNDDILKTLNRIHNANDALITIENIKKAGIENFSIDLIYGIFGQTLKNIKLDLAFVKNIKPNHISTYGLKIEKGTPFEKFNKTNLPDEDMCAKMYEFISGELISQGFNHYEISNFAKSDFEAKHNLVYWKNREYFGLGAAAHGYLNKTRYQNSNNINEYIRNPLAKKILKNNTEEDILEETIMLGLRLKEGINLYALQEKFNVNLLKIRKNEIEKFIQTGHATLENGRLSLTTKGFLISNYIIGELI